MEWIKIKQDKSNLPDHCTHCLVSGFNSAGKIRVTTAWYYKRKKQSCDGTPECQGDCEDMRCEYVRENDTWYLPEGWMEEPVCGESFYYLEDEITVDKYIVIKDTGVV